MSGIDSQSADNAAELVLALATGTARSALQAGARAPLFLLPDASGRMVGLEQRLRQGPMVLHFHRGNWCSYGERSQMQFCASYAQLIALGAGAVAISPDRASGQTASDPSVPDLYDKDLLVARSYGLVFELPQQLQESYQRLGYQATSAGTWLVPIPAVYLLDRDGTIAMSSLELDYRKTYDPEPMLHALRAMQARRAKGIRRLF